MASRKKRPPVAKVNQPSPTGKGSIRPDGRPSPQAVIRPKPPLGSVLIQGVEGGEYLIAELGDNVNPVPQRGQKIEISDRPRREAATIWTGSTPGAFDLAIMLDSWFTDRTVERPSKTLDALAATDPDGKRNRPANIIWDTAGVIPYDFTEKPRIEWWITKVDRPDGAGNVIRSHTGNRRRELITIGLQAVNEDEFLSALAERNWEKRVRANRRKSKRTRVRVVKGQDLVDVARDQLKNSRRWREIADLNDLRGPKVKPGTLLNLP